MYGYHRCRCLPCGDANRDYNRAATRHRARRPMVDANLVRARIAVLRAAGLTLVEIADLCALNPKVIDYAVTGRKGRLPTTVKASTLDALNAIRHRDIVSIEKPAGRKTDGDIPRRQVQCLHSFGWSTTDIAARIGATAPTVNRLLKGYMTTEELRARIQQAYTDLHGTCPATATTAEKNRATRARARAAAHGWTADTAEDHEYYDQAA